MKHRIAVGAIVVRDEKILLVNHKREGKYDFWVAPGGGVIETETQEEGVIREVKEETGLSVEVDSLIYIEEFWQPSQREVKFWYLCNYVSGDIDTTAEEATREHIVSGKFIERSQLSKLTVFPSVVLDQLWEDLKKEKISPYYLGLSEMQFY